ncbi:MAG: hypothetical protein ABSD42_05840 [Candidatus Bathyarchaeia archaeon]|jgi:hypothetical protein
MATYREIQAYIERTYGFVPIQAWIAEVKKLHHIPLVRNQSKRMELKELTHVLNKKFQLLKKP